MTVRWSQPGSGASCLPTATELLYAVGGRRAEGPVCSLASALSESYRLEAGLAGIRLQSRRRTLIGEIDAWSSRHLPVPAAGTRVYERTLGELIDVIAAGAARAFHLLRHDDPAGELMHFEWTRLAELQLVYRDLVHDVESGRCCLPSGPHLRVVGDRMPYQLPIRTGESN
ncbi:hypothetical protein [Nocardia grenadensis]|uniref:hypothetical protein n=1 Tax=Nocardia grenadensis TaxID=931537 RepID=UPI0007A42F62|nr:hypothetical protein [Nocardia grenadensis]